MNEDLIVTFGKGDGGTHDWKYKGLDPDLSVPKIKEACELLTRLDICTENGVNLFDSIVTAKVVTTIDTLIFDPEHETKGVNYYGEPAPEATCEEVGCVEVADEPKKVEKESLSKAKRTISEQDEPTQNSVALTDLGPAIKSKKEHNRLFHWIHRLRKRNKEDPLDTPRE